MNGRSAPLVFSNLRRVIIQLSPARKQNSQILDLVRSIIFTRHKQPSDADAASGTYCLHRGGIHLVPKVAYALVCVAPALHYIGQIIFGYTHIESAHIYQCTRSALISKSELRNLALLPQGVLRIALFILSIGTPNICEADAS